MSHPDVAEAAIIAARHEKWDERPLLIIVPREGKEIDKKALLSFYEGKVATARWFAQNRLPLLSAERVVAAATTLDLMDLSVEDF